jgi:MFS family permease
MLSHNFPNKDKFYRRFIPFTISLALFMEAVDTTIINTAIPAMSKSLHVGPIDLKIALISYLMSLAIFIPISGWIADKYGVKRVFIGAMCLFIFSSFWCGYAVTLWQLVLARTLQGLGGALMTPVGRLIIARFFERHELITIMGRIVMIAAIGMMLGPAIGGYITHYFSWRWIFWVNIPIGIFTVAMASYSIMEMKPKIIPKLDKLGFVLFGSGLASISFGFSVVSQSAIDHFFAVVIIFCGIILLFLYA